MEANARMFRSGLSGPRALTRRSGVILMLVSALVFSTAGLFTKGVAADAWSVIFWRGLFAALFTVFYIQWNGKIRQEFLCMGKPGWIISIFGAAGTAAFIPAFKLTSIANVSLIYAIAPFASACVAWMWFRERPTLSVMVASLVALFGVLLIVSGSLGTINLGGDFLALWMTLMMSLVMVIYRRYPQTPAAGPSVMASLFLLPLGFFYGDPFSAPFGEIVIMAAFGLIFAVASVTLQEGARRLPPAEAALISATETPLAPVWAWMLFSEVPPIFTIAGGVVILLAVFGSQIINLKKQKIIEA